MAKLELSINKNYLGKWSSWEGIREHVSNGRDAEIEFNAPLKITHLGTTLRIENEDVELKREALLLGTSSKMGRTDTIGRHGEENDASRKVFEGLRPDEPHGGPQEPGDLGVVAAGMSRARRGIRDRVSCHHQPVELAQQREGRTVRLAACHATHAGEGKPTLGLEPDLPHGLLDKPRGLELFEAQLRVLPDRLADLDDLLALAVDGLADGAFDVITGGHGGSCRVVGLG